MINYLGRSTVIENGITYTVGDANFKLVPESYILRMKNALALQCPPCENACFHYFLGLDISEYARIKSSTNALDYLFQQLKGTYLQSCGSICKNPDVDFCRYRRENRCFPISKVYDGLRDVCQNAANQLLDPGLIEDIELQIKEHHKKLNLLVYRIKRNKLTESCIFIKKLLIRDFKILVVDFDALNVSEVQMAGPSEDMQQDNFQNLTQNIGKNFAFRLVPRPSREMGRWEQFVDNQIKYDADVIVSVVNNSMADSVNKWRTMLVGHGANHSLNSIDGILEYDEGQIDDDARYQYMMYKKIIDSDKIKIAILFNDDLIGDLVQTFPLTFVLPREMKKLLFMLEEIRKEF